MQDVTSFSSEMGREEVGFSESVLRLAYWKREGRIGRDFPHMVELPNTTLITLYFKICNIGIQE